MSRGSLTGRLGSSSGSLPERFERLVVPRLPIPDNSEFQQSDSPLSPQAPQTPRLPSPSAARSAVGTTSVRGSPRFGQPWPSIADGSEIGHSAHLGFGAVLPLAAKLGTSFGNGHSLSVVGSSSTGAVISRGSARRPNPLLGSSPSRGVTYQQSPQKNSSQQVTASRLSDRATVRRGSASSPNLLILPLQESGQSLQTQHGGRVSDEGRGRRTEARLSSSSATAALGLIEVKATRLGDITCGFGDQHRNDFEVLVSPLPFMSLMPPAPVSPADSMCQQFSGKVLSLYQSPPAAGGLFTQRGQIREPRSSVRSSYGYHGTPSQKSLLDSGARRSARTASSFMTMTDASMHTPELDSPGEVEVLCDKAQDLLMELRALVATPAPSSASPPLPADGFTTSSPSRSRPVAALVAATPTPTRPAGRHSEAEASCFPPAELSDLRFRVSRLELLLEKVSGLGQQQATLESSLADVQAEVREAHSRVAVLTRQVQVTQHQSAGVGVGATGAATGVRIASPARTILASPGLASRHAATPQTPGRLPLQADKPSVRVAAKEAVLMTGATISGTASPPATARRGDGLMSPPPWPVGMKPASPSPWMRTQANAPLLVSTPPPTARAGQNFFQVPGIPLPVRRGTPQRGQPEQNQKWSIRPGFAH